MKTIIAFVMLLFIPALRGQPVDSPGKQTVLVLLRQPEGTLDKRLAGLPSSTTVPDEVRTAALREQTSMVQAQQESFDQRIAAIGATAVVHYPELNMMRVDVPAAALSWLRSDPAVESVTPLSEETQAASGVKVSPPPAANLGVGVPPMAGVAAGMLGLRSEAFQSPSLLTNGVPAGTTASGLPPALVMGQKGAMNSPMMSAMQMPGMQMAGMQGPGMQMPGMQMPGFPGTGGMFQSLLGVTGQMGMQAETAMPKAAGFAMLLSGTAQLAQVILANRKPGCSLTLATAGTQVPEGGGEGVIAVNAPPSCLWQAHSDSDWLKINTEGPMIGPGIIKYNASPASAGMLRTGVITMVGVANSRPKGKTSITVRQGQ